MELIYNYMQDDTLRHALNRLAQKTFGFDFESWVKGGYFEGDYIPYSFLEDGELLANASANKMCFLQNGVRKNYIQIGTVMTDKAWRNQGLARKLVEHILGEYEGKCNGIYLFANLGALGFYRKIAFAEGLEYRFVLKKEWLDMEKKGTAFQKANPQDEALKAKYRDTVRNSAVNSALEQVNKYGLQMFYTADLDGVYYAEDIDCFAVMELQENALTLQSIVCKEQVSLKDVTARIDLPHSCLRLGFTPCAEDAGLFESFPYNGAEDYRLFYRGEDLRKMETDRLFFPQMSHA